MDVCYAYGNQNSSFSRTSLPVTFACRCRDVHCGRIQCQGGRDRPLLGTNAEILTTRVHFNNSDLVCRGTFFHLGDDVSDPATVAHGTACGRGKVRQRLLQAGGQFVFELILFSCSNLNYATTKKD